MDSLDIQVVDSLTVNLNQEDYSTEGQVLNSIDVYVEDEQLLFDAALTLDSINLYTREIPDIINIKEITDGISRVENEIKNTSKEATLLAKVAELKEVLNTIDFTAIEQAIQGVENITAKEATLSNGIDTLSNKINNIDLSSVENKVDEGVETLSNKIDNIDLTSIESKVETESQTIQSAIQNIDLSSVEGKVEEVKQAVDNIKLPEIDTTELAKEATLQDVKSSVEGITVPLSAISGLALELEGGKKNIVNALKARGVQASESEDTLTSLAAKVYDVKNPIAFTVPAETSNELANGIFNTMMKSQKYDEIYESVFKKFCSEGGTYVGCLMTDIYLSGKTTINLTGADGYYIYEEDKYYETDSSGNLTTFLNGSLVQLGTKSHLFDTNNTLPRRIIFYLYIDGSTKDGEKDTTLKSFIDYCRDSIIPNVKFSHNSGYYMHYHFSSPELCTVSRSSSHATNVNQLCAYFYTNAHNLGSCYINYNSSYLSFLDLSNAKNATGTLVNNAGIRHLDLSKLETLNNSSAIIGCTLLSSVNLDNLATIDSASKIIESCHLIDELSIPNIKTLYNRSICKCTFDRISLPNAELFSGSVADGGGDAAIIDTRAREINIPKLKRVDDSLALGNNMIEELYAPELEYVGANIAASCKKLKKINLPKLSLQDHYGSNISILTNLPLLEEALLPSLQSVRAYGVNPYWMAALPMLKHLQIPSVVFVKSQHGPYMFNDGKEINMIWLELSDEPNASFKIRKWNPTNAYLTDSSSLVDEGESYANNYEKFLDKFKTGIADKLVDRTGQSALTISLNSNLVSKLSADVKSIITNKNWSIASV